MDGSVIIWDARTGDPIRTLKGNQAGILDFDIRSDDTIIVTGSDDGTSLVFPLI
jgi:WD40 repeat protein